MDLCGHFEYNGVQSRKYGLVLANAETDRLKILSGTVNGKTIFNKASKRKHMVGSDYAESPVSFEIDIISDQERPFSVHERRQMEKWLFYSTQYQKLYLDITEDYAGETYELIDGQQKRLYLECRFVNPERLEFNGGIVGYKATVECASGFFTQDAVTKLFETQLGSADESAIIEIDVDTDIRDYVYPQVTIQMGTSGGDITIINNTDNETRLTKFVDLSPSSRIVMKGELNYISGQNYEKFAYQNFIRLIDGTNRLTISGNIESIEFEFQNKRFL